MNLSGDCVQPAAAFLKVEPREIIVVHDELDLPFGEVRLKMGGGHAGHNGLRSIIERLGTPGLRPRARRRRASAARLPGRRRGLRALQNFDAMRDAPSCPTCSGARLRRGRGRRARRAPQAAMNALNAQPKPRKEAIFVTRRRLAC